MTQLRALGVAYPCRCSRADIAAAATAPHGSDGAAYPGTCRRRPIIDAAGVAWRINTARALALVGPLEWHDAAAGRVNATPAIHGDFVVARRHIGTACALAVVIDDATQGITDVVRGADLFAATHNQGLLQAAAWTADPALPPPSAGLRPRQQTPRQARRGADARRPAQCRHFGSSANARPAAAT